MTYAFRLSIRVGCLDVGRACMRTVWYPLSDIVNQTQKRHHGLFCQWPGQIRDAIHSVSTGSALSLGEHVSQVLHLLLAILKFAWGEFEATLSQMVNHRMCGGSTACSGGPRDQKVIRILKEDRPPQGGKALLKSRVGQRQTLQGSRSSPEANDTTCIVSFDV